MDLSPLAIDFAPKARGVLKGFEVDAVAQDRHTSTSGLLFGELRGSLRNTKSLPIYGGIRAQNYP